MPTADLQVTISDGTTTAVPGTVDTYTITGTNNGPDDLTGASVFGQPLAGLTNVTWGVTGFSNGGSVSGPMNGTAALNAFVNLPANASVTFNLIGVIDPNATGTINSIEYRHGVRAGRDIRSHPRQQRRPRHRHIDTASDGRPVGHRDRRQDQRRAGRHRHLHDRGHQQRTGYAQQPHPD